MVKNVKTKEEIVAKDIKDILWKREKQQHYKERLLKRDDMDAKDAQAAAEEAERAKRELDEVRQRSRANKQGDWYSIMIAMFETMAAHGRALHAESAAKRFETTIKASVVGQAPLAAWRGLIDWLSWGVTSPFKKEVNSPDITFNIKIDGKGIVKTEVKVNGSIPAKDYFGLNDGTPAGAKRAKDCERFEAHFQEGFESWFQSKGYKKERLGTVKQDPKDPKSPDVEQYKIVDTNNKEITQTELMQLNQGNGNLTEYLSGLTKLNVTSETDDRPDATPNPSSIPTPTTTTPKP